MVHGRLSPVLRYLRRTLGPDCGPGVSDAELLERFLAARDETAFEVLVWRHGAMVWGVCRRLLDDAGAAEDAFQATFLVLVRKAASIGKREALGSWLHRVASRIALRARRDEAKRSGREQASADLRELAGAAPPDPATLELQRIVTEELGRLPEKYRAPVVLCYLEGKAYDEAARQLGCPKGTLSTRLTRARALLRTRLEGRGLALSAALVTGALSARAAAPDPLVQITLQAVRLSAAGTTVAGVATRAAVLAEGVLHTMRMTKLKSVAVVLLALILAGAGAGVLTAGGGRAARCAPLGVPAVEELELLRRDNVRLKARVDLLEKEVDWLRRDLARLRPPTRKSEGRRLQWRFEKGKPFLQELTTVTEQTMKVMGGEVQQVQKQTLVFRWTPLRHDPDGSWTFRLKIEKVKLDIEIGGNRVTYDSSDPGTAGPLKDFYRALTGSEFLIRIGPDLKVRKVQGREALLARLAKESPQLKAVGELILNTATTPAEVDALFQGTPSPVLRVGSSWSQTGKLDLGPVGTMVARYRYTYEGLEGNREKVKIGAMLTFQPPLKRTGTKTLVVVQQGQLKTKEMTGTLRFDRGRNRLDRVDLRLTFEGRFALDVAGQETMVDLAQTQTTTIKVTDPSAPSK